MRVVECIISGIYLEHTFCRECVSMCVRVYRGLHKCAFPDAYPDAYPDIVPAEKRYFRRHCTPL
jgi:hypothetical protein